jgi:hypothetical protein
MKWWSCCSESSDQLIIAVNYFHEAYIKSVNYYFFLSVSVSNYPFFASFSRGLSFFCMSRIWMDKSSVRDHSLFIFKPRQLGWHGSCLAISFSFQSFGVVDIFMNAQTVLLSCMDSRKSSNFLKEYRLNVGTWK